MAETAKPAPTGVVSARPGGEFFARPTGPNHRRYEALRGYLFEGLPIEAAAERAGHSAKEISELLLGTPTPLNRTGVAEVLTEAGFPRLPVRPPAERGAPYRDHPRRAQVCDFAELPARAETKLPGLLLAIPELVALDLPALVAAAGYPGTVVIPAVSSLLSLLAHKLIGVRRVSHVDDLAADPAAGLFAGLSALPKATALTTYSYRLTHTHQQRFLAGLGRAMLAWRLSSPSQLVTIRRPSDRGRSICIICDALPAAEC